MYMQNRNRLTENKLVVSKGDRERESGKLGVWC